VFVPWLNYIENPVGLLRFTMGRGDVCHPEVSYLLLWRHGELSYRKPPRIRKSFLQRPKKLGGMALPNFQYYYWAANIRALHYWLHSDTLSPPPTWLQMEALSCKPTSLKALMYSPLGFPLSPYTKNVCVKTSLRIWNQFRKHFNLKALSTLSPLTTNW